MQYGTQAERIGKLKGEILKHAKPVEVLGITGDHFKMPKNSSKTVVYRRWLPFGGATTNPTTINQWSVSPNSHLTEDGVTPDPDDITPQDITVTLSQYSCLYMYTDAVADLYEDNIPMAMKEQCGERMGLVREMIHYGALKGCTNKIYAGGGSTRASVNAAITLPLLRKATKSILGNRGNMVTKILSASANFNTAPVEASFIVFVHTDCEHDIRELPNFREVAAYGQRAPLHEMEVGSTDRYRFIVSPELSSIIDSGATVGATGLVSTGGSNIDVYPYLMIGRDAWAQVALRGMDSFGVRHIPHTTVDSADPLGQRGYLGTKFWCADFVQNDGWMVVAECGATDV